MFPGVAEFTQYQEEQEEQIYFHEVSNKMNQETAL